MSGERAIYFPTFIGLLSIEHKEQIGTALWEFLWCIDKTTREVTDGDSGMIGLVLGGMPVTASRIADDLGGSEKQILRNLTKLETAGYLTLKNAGKGQIIHVKKSKKFTKNMDKNVRSDTDVPPDINVPSPVETEDINVPSRTDINVSSDINVPSRTDINVLANKTMQLDHADKEKEAAALSADLLALDDDDSVYATLYEYATSKLNAHFLDGHDTPVMWSWIHDGIPLVTIREGIDKAFAEYKPQRQGQRIKTIRYCDGKIRDLHGAKMQAEQAKAQAAAASAPQQLSDWEEELRRRMQA